MLLRALLLSPPLEPISQCDSTAIRLRHDYDEKFFARLESRRMEAGARDTS